MITTGLVVGSCQAYAALGNVSRRLKYGVLPKDGSADYAVAERFMKSGRLKTFSKSHGAAYAEDPEQREQLMAKFEGLLDKPQRKGDR